jgi:uncharacterized membrane protein
VAGLVEYRTDVDPAALWYTLFALFSCVRDCTCRVCGAVGIQVKCMIPPYALSSSSLATSLRFLSAAVR